MGAVPMRGGNGSRSISIWSLVLALSVIAFWRTIAPERSARAIQKFMNQHEYLRTTTNKTDSQFGELRRMRASIRREKKALLALREEIKKLNLSGSDLYADGPTALGASIKKNSQVAGTERKEMETTEEVENSINEEEDEELLTNCDMVLAPLAAEAGLGTQTEHLWKQLTLAKYLNACVALPPIVARTSAAMKYIPIHEIVDIGPLLDVIKIVPLSACKRRGVGALVGDGITTDAFVRYLKSSDPILAAETLLVKNDTTVTAFLSEDDLEKQVSIVRKATAFCIGTGKMTSAITFDDTVINLFNAASKVSNYVTDRFREIENNLFVRLRWRKGACENTAAGFVCLGDSSTVPINEYVSAIKEKAKKVEAESIYISFPPLVPMDVMKYFTDNIRTIDNVMLRLEGDEFAANVVEREIALRSKAFVDDGGVWGATIQNKRRLRNSETYEENASSAEMINQWKESASLSNEGFFVPNHIQEKNEQAEEENSQPEEPQPEISNQEDTERNDNIPELETNSDSVEAENDAQYLEPSEEPLPENIVDEAQIDENSQNENKELESGSDRQEDEASKELDSSIADDTGIESALNEAKTDLEGSDENPESGTEQIEQEDPAPFAGSEIENDGNISDSENSAQKLLQEQETKTD